MIANVTIANSSTLLFTVPSGKTYTSISMWFTNRGTVDETITVFACAPSATPGDLTVIAHTISIKAGDTAVFDNAEKLILQALCNVYALGSVGDQVSCTASWMEL